MRGDDNFKTLTDKVRFTADPDSFDLIVKEKIRRGDVVIVLDENHFIG